MAGRKPGHDERALFDTSLRPLAEIGVRLAVVVLIVGSAGRWHGSPRPGTSHHFSADWSRITSTSRIAP